MTTREYNKPVIEFVKQNHTFARTYTSTLANGTKRLKFFAVWPKDYEYPSFCDLMDKMDGLKEEIEKNFPEWKVAEPKSNSLNLYRG